VTSDAAGTYGPDEPGALVHDRIENAVNIKMIPIIFLIPLTFNKLILKENDIEKILFSAIKGFKKNLTFISYDPLLSPVHLHLFSL
jgi:hypothetical protein